MSRIKVRSLALADVFFLKLSITCPKEFKEASKVIVSSIFFIAS
jgi:hypothetical protein